MRKKLSCLLVTGGAGFIGSAFVRLALKKGYRIVILDKLTYAADRGRLAEVKNKCVFLKGDICDKKIVEAVFKKYRPQTVVHFAAETHVDRSIRDASAFLQTNIIGTQVLLDAARKYPLKRFIHISTDEVYGEIAKGEFTESSPLQPNSPYAASKAAGDLLIKSYARTYNFPAIIVRPCNNYGIWQYPEKLISLSILKIFRNEKIPIYGKGLNVREWLYVEDCAQGILEIVNKGKIGEVYNLGSNEERQNIDVIKKLLYTVGVSRSLIEFVKDRPGHDIRYKLSAKKVLRDIGWKPRINLEDGLRLTVAWSRKNRNWLLSKWKEIAPLYK